MRESLELELGWKVKTLLSVLTIFGMEASVYTPHMKLYCEVVMTW